MKSYISRSESDYSTRMSSFSSKRKNDVFEIKNSNNLLTSSRKTSSGMSNVNHSRSNFLRNYETLYSYIFSQEKLDLGGFMHNKQRKNNLDFRDNLQNLQNLRYTFLSAGKNKKESYYEFMNNKNNLFTQDLIDTNRSKSKLKNFYTNVQAKNEYNNSI